jgi:Isochorismatase family
MSARACREQGPNAVRRTSLFESSARFAVELGYHVALVRDATAAASLEAMHAAHDINAPNFAHAVLTTSELPAVLPPAGLRNT